MNFIKKHKLTTFIIVIYIAAVIVAYFLYKIFMGSNGLPVYGDRLDGIDNVKISDEQKENLKKKLMEDNNVITVRDPHLSGRTYDITIIVSDSMNRDEAKKLADRVTESLTAEQNNFYDVQVFIKKKYNCTIIATGKADEEGVFTGDVVVQFKDDLSKDKDVLGYGLSTNNNKEYNAKQKEVVNTDGEVVFYGFTQDKVGESTCSIKIVRNQAKNADSKETASKEVEINSSTGENFPIIGYKRKGSQGYSWTKDR
jgi:hypothetical protein